MRKMWMILLIVLLVASVVVGIVAAQDTDEFKTPQELADPNGNFADIDGVSIYYVSEGNPENPAVFFIHGFGGSSVSWRDNLQPIAEAGYYAVALDLPPFGLSDKSADIGYSRSDYADYVVGLMDELNIETATIVGHSMGGAVTAYVAVNHPERVDSLVFVDGGIFSPMGEAADSDDTSGSVFELFAQIDPESPFATQIMQRLVSPSTFTNLLADAYYDESVLTEEVAEDYQRPLRIQGWAQGFLAYLSAEEQSPITLEDLAQNTADTPVLFMWGQQDTWVTIDVGRNMEAALSNTQFITYANVGHLPMEESTAQFNADLLSFLRELK